MQGTSDLNIRTEKPWQIIKLVLAGLLICLLLDGFIDFDVAFAGVVILVGLWGLLEKPSNASTKSTVARGIYITKEVTAYTDAREGTPQHPAVVVERGSKEPLAWVANYRLGQQRCSSDSTKAPRRASSVVGKLQSHLKAAAPEGSSKIEPAITEGPTDDRAWLEEIAREIGLGAIEAPTYGQPSIEVESNAPLQNMPLAIESPSDGLPSTIDDSAVSFMGSETTAPKSKVLRAVRERVARLRLRREKKSRVARAPIRRGKDKKERAERAERLVEEGPEAGDLMVGLELTNGDTESVEGGDPMDLRPDDSAIDVDEVMIGSDVDGEMEIDGETPDSDRDSSIVDGKPPQLAPGRINKVGPIKERSKCDYNKVLDGTFRCEKAGTPLRETPKFAVSGPVIPSAQLSQQQTVPIPAPEIGNTDASLLQGVAQNLISTNSAADLMEARLGKRSETTVAPSASNPSPIQSPPTSLPNGAMAEREDSSDTTQPTTTPASSLPSSTTSSVPASPLVKDTASTTRGSPKKCGDGASAGEAKDDQKKRQGPGVSNDDASEPYSEKASKRVQQRRGNTAGADAEIIPLNELPDPAPTGRSWIHLQYPFFIIIV